MSIKDYFYITFRSLIRNKKNIFYIIIVILCSILGLGVFVFQYNFSKYVNDSITKNIGFRTLSVSPIIEYEDLGYDLIYNTENVVDVYSFLYHTKLVESDLKNLNLDGSISLLYGTIDTSPNVTIGRKFNEKERNVAICPINFYPDESAYELKINKEYLIDGKQLLDKNIRIKYYSKIYDSELDKIINDKEYEKDFTIIGLYDNKKTMDLNNQCYIPADDIKEMVNLGRPALQEGQETYPYFYVVVDSLYNVEKVKQKLESNELIDRVYIKNEIDPKLVRTITLSESLMLSLILTTIIILTSSYIKKKIVNESKEIGVLRASGYNKKVVRNIYLSGLFLVNFLSYIIGLIIFIIIYFILNNSLFETVSYLGIKIIINPISILLSMFIIIIISLIVGFFHISKKNKQDILKLIGNEE